MTAATIDASVPPAGRETRAPEVAAPRTLDALLSLDASELARLYREARVPSLRALDGALEGRMLVSPRGGRALASLMRGLARSALFPWRGKTFRSAGDDSGDGFNRVVSDRFSLFRFTTSIGPSRAGGFDAVQLDYDHRPNPAFVRAVKDEVREVAPGLFLGQAYLRVRGRDHLALYFALASR